MGRHFCSRILLVVAGLFSAGVAFALQNVLGSFAAWIGILAGRVFRVGDRVMMGGVRGDVIDVSPLRTTIMEIGSPGSEEGSDVWVRARQYTGRVVTGLEQDLLRRAHLQLLKGLRLHLGGDNHPPQVRNRLGARKGDTPRGGPGGLAPLSGG